MRIEPVFSVMAIVLIATRGSAHADASRPLAERFATPPAESRILKIVHGLPDAPDQQDALIRSLLEQGFGGMVVNDSFDGYLEDEPKWQAFVRGVTEARKAGMALWLYDERGYPSGTAGGITLRDHPEWEARGLLIADAVCEGGPVSLDVPPGRLVRAAAFPISGGAIHLEGGVDLSASISGGKLSWEAPVGSWHVMVITEDRLYDGTHAAVSLAYKLPCTNLLMAEPTARFLEVTHGQYAAHLGDDLGKWLVATFTDEPSLMSLFMRPQPYRVLPWAPNLPVEFEKRRGYALAPVIPALVADAACGDAGAGAKGQAARYDFWLTVGELVSENFFGQIQAWCRPHNTLSGGHLLYEEPLLHHVPLYGDFFRCARRLDAPSIDCLTSVPEDVPWYIARLLSSAGELECKTVTMCETSDFAQHYRPAGDTRPVRDVTEAEIRGTCNRLIVNGITTITSYYSFAGLSNEQMVRLNQWIGRCCTMLAGGFQVTDVALVYPVESVWPRFVPSRSWVSDCPPSAHQIERIYRSAADSLYTSRRDFTYVDGSTLTGAQVENGVLKHGNLQWRIVVLPCADTLPLRAWENLAQFWRTGGAIVALTALPANSEKEFPSPRVQALADEIFGKPTAPNCNTNAAGGAGIFLPVGCEALLPTALNSFLEPDANVRIANARSAIRCTHRRIDGREVYFVINDGRELWEGQVTFAAAGEPEQWDPATGQANLLASAEAIPLRLEPFGGMLFRFKEARSPRRAAAQQGALAGLQLTPLPKVQPSLARGEFVGAELGPADAKSGLRTPAWRAIGTITKGQVDTFLFASFDYPQPVALSGAGWLSVETWVPEGQSTPVELLIILRDTNGIEYLASTGRFLNAAGRVRCFVPLERFERAGWNKAPEGTLDFTTIVCGDAGAATIRVGWGGYLGKEGETIEFGLSAPEVGKADV